MQPSEQLTRSAQEQNAMDKAKFSVVNRRSVLVSTGFGATQFAAGWLGMGGVARAQSRPRPSAALYVVGNAMQANTVLTQEQLRAMPDAIQGSFTQTREGASAQTNARSTVRGVRLAGLIEQLGLSNLGRNQWKNVFITATATDGYRAHFTWVELINTPAGEGTLVLHERDGQPLGEREGLIALQATNDFRLGARHVRNLNLIEVVVV